MAETKEKFNPFTDKIDDESSDLLIESTENLTPSELEEAKNKAGVVSREEHWQRILDSGDDKLAEEMRSADKSKLLETLTADGKTTESVCIGWSEEELKNNDFIKRIGFEQGIELLNNNTRLQPETQFEDDMSCAKHFDKNGWPEIIEITGGDVNSCVYDMTKKALRQSKMIILDANELFADELNGSQKNSEKILWLLKLVEKLPLDKRCFIMGSDILLITDEELGDQIDLLKKELSEPVKEIKNLSQKIPIMAENIFTKNNDLLKDID